MLLLLVAIHLCVFLKNSHYLIYDLCVVESSLNRHTESEFSKSRSDSLMIIVHTKSKKM